jgi:signal transduction histidine kinase
MQHLSRLVVDLLDVSRIRVGKLEVRMAPCDLAEIVREAAEEQQQIAPTRTIQLRVAGRRHVHVMADADRIGQVVANYLTNALNYSPEDRPVEVYLRVDGAWARVSVRDGGPGVPAAEQPRIWERFYRVEGARPASAASTGLGFGLYLSKTIIEQHQGRVGVRSTPGKGSTFWFMVPLGNAQV